MGDIQRWAQLARAKQAALRAALKGPAAQHLPPYLGRLLRRGRQAPPLRQRVAVLREDEALRVEPVVWAGPPVLVVEVRENVLVTGLTGIALKEGRQGREEKVGGEEGGEERGGKRGERAGETGTARDQSLLCSVASR